MNTESFLAPQAEWSVKDVTHHSCPSRCCKFWPLKPGRKAGKGTWVIVGKRASPYLQVAWLSIENFLGESWKSFRAKISFSGFLRTQDSCIKSMPSLYEYSPKTNCCLSPKEQSRNKSHRNVFSMFMLKTTKQQTTKKVCMTRETDTCFGIQRRSISIMTVHPKATCESSTFPNQIPAALYVATPRLFLEFMWKHSSPCTGTILKKNQVRGHTNFKTYHIALYTGRTQPYKKTVSWLSSSHWRTHTT